MGEGGPVSHNDCALATLILSTEFVHNPVYTGMRHQESRCRGKGLRQNAQGLSSCACAARRSSAQRERAGNIVAVTRLRPEFLLR